jgi:hypothetical protein
MEELLNKFKNFNDVFENFKIEDKIKEFSTIVGESLDALEGQHIVIAVPTMDESNRSICLNDEALFHAQQNDAHILAQHIMYNMSADWVTVIADFNKVDQFEEKIIESIDWLVLLHEFVDVEKRYIINALTENNANLQIVKLY